MKFPRILLICLGLLASLWLGTAQALPTVDEVQAAAQRGDYAGAEKMMREVVAAKPDSARAHYVLAEILAHGRQFNEAAEHTRRARALDPAIKFTDPAKFNAFEQLLQREQVPTAKAALPAAVGAAPVQRVEPAAPASGGGVPIWLLVGGAIVFIWLAMRWMRRRTEAQNLQPAMAGGYGMGNQGFQGNPGYGPGMPQAPGSGGPGMMGVGLGVAGGLAAGMLAEKLLHGGHDERSLPRDRADAGGGSGLVPGSFDAGADNAASELTRRDIDFGSGDGWTGGDGGGGDMGSGGGDDW